MINFEDIKETCGRAQNVLSAVNKENLTLKQQSLLLSLNNVECLKNQDMAKQLGAENRKIEEILKLIINIENGLKNFNVIKENQSEDYTELEDLLNEELATFKKDIEALETFTYYNGEYDNTDALVEIHSGAGGEDAQDWAEMLALMYIKYANANDFDVQIIDATDGDGAGIKSETLKIS